MRTYNGNWLKMFIDILNDDVCDETIQLVLDDLSSILIYDTEFKTLELDEPDFLQKVQHDVNVQLYIYESLCDYLRVNNNITIKTEAPSRKNVVLNVRGLLIDVD